MSKFVPGEVATIATTAKTTLTHLLKYRGEEVTLIRKEGEDWYVEHADKYRLIVKERVLIKKKPPVNFAKELMERIVRTPVSETAQSQETTWKEHA
jgi:hypothetical protein